MSPTKRTELVKASLSYTEMRDFLPKIDRRMNDLDSFDVNLINERFDPSIKALSDKLEALLVSIYDINTVEYSRYHHSLTDLDAAALYIWRQISIGEVRDGLKKWIARAKATLNTIKSEFKEELQDSGETVVGKTLKAYEWLELHPNIEKAVGKLFRDWHYSNAIEDAVKVLNALVRMNSGIDDKDGMQLMESVFSPNAPILKLNNLIDQSDKDEQKWFMMMFSWAVSGLRNPRAHKIIRDDPEMALEFIAFISLLAKFADKASR